MVLRKKNGTKMALRKRNGGIKETRRRAGRKRAKMEPQFLTADKSKRFQT